MQYELLGHPDGVQVLSIADLPQHVGNARSAGLFECRQNTALSQTHRLHLKQWGNSRPYPIHLLLHSDLLLPERRRCLCALLLDIRRLDWLGRLAIFRRRW